MPGLAAALLVLALALVAAYGAIWRAGLARTVAVVELPADSPLRHTSRADASYEAWLVARHARTLRTHPWRLFDTEICAPEHHALTYGIPMIAMGVLAIPFSLATHNPIAIYNLTLALQSAVAALAMFALVRAWTGLGTAALVAALLFAFHPLRLRNITHPAEWEIVWTLVALFFAERLLRGGRWRDAAGFFAATALQIGASFYQLLAAGLLTPAFGVWLVARDGLRGRKLVPLGAALAGIALATALLLGPYLVARESGQIGERTAFGFATWPGYAPGGPHFLGFALLALAAAGLALPKRLALPGIAGDPRLALAVGALVVAFVAAGPDTALRLRGLGVPRFDPYAALASILPGLDTIRGVMRLSTGVHLVACILAGAGAAALLRLAGRRAALLGPALVAAALVACFGLPPLVGRGYAWRIETIHPGAERIAFFEQLALMGNQGPLLELPLDGEHGRPISLGAARILVSAWHGRTTSACFGSFASARRQELSAHIAGLPGRESAAALREQGFTTLVVHHGQRRTASPLLEMFERAARAPDAPFEELQRTDALSAFALRAATEPAQ